MTQEQIDKELDELEDMVATGQIGVHALLTQMSQLVHAGHARYAGGESEPVAEMDERIQDLCERLRATDSKARHLSLSEQHELCDFIDELPYGPLYTQPVGYAGGGEAVAAVSLAGLKFIAAALTVDELWHGEMTSKLSEALDFLRKHTDTAGSLYASPAPAVPDGHVKMPESPDEAQMMANLGIRYLQDNHPERLRSTPPALAGEGNAACYTMKFDYDGVEFFRSGEAIEYEDVLNALNNKEPQ